MIYFLKITSEIIAAILGLIFISIAIAWSKRNDKHYKTIDINEWRDMHILNIKLKKRKTILEKEVINIILEKEEIE